MDEKKQIEELAKDFCKYCLLKFGVDDIDKGIEFCQFKDDCNTINKAKYLYEQGYRNCKDKVVLTRGEYETLKNESAEIAKDYQEMARFYDEKCEELEQARKETAREILTLVDKEAPNGTLSDEFWDIVYDKYGVEVE